MGSAEGAFSGVEEVGNGVTKKLYDKVTVVKCRPTVYKVREYEGRLAGLEGCHYCSPRSYREASRPFQGESKYTVPFQDFSCKRQK